MFRQVLFAISVPMARGEECAAQVQQQTAFQRARRSIVVVICTVACFAAFCGFLYNQQGSGKIEQLEIRAGVSTKTPISAYHKLTSKSSLDEDAVDWAEEEVSHESTLGC
jgi:hypothetical protein